MGSGGVSRVRELKGDSGTKVRALGVTQWVQGGIGTATALGVGGSGGKNGTDMTNCTMMEPNVKNLCKLQARNSQCVQHMQAIRYKRNQFHELCNMCFVWLRQLPRETSPRKSSNMPVELKGSCHCGAVKFSVMSSTPSPYQVTDGLDFAVTQPY
jgi:hypothetical protein